MTVMNDYRCTRCGKEEELRLNKEDLPEALCSGCKEKGSLTLLLAAATVCKESYPDGTTGKRFDYLRERMKLDKLKASDPTNMDLRKRVNKEKDKLKNGGKTDE